MIGSLDRNFFSLALGRLLQVAVMLASIKVSTAFLSTSEIGNLYIIVTLTGFFGLFLINPVGQYINRKTHEWYASGVILNKLVVYFMYVLLATLLSLFLVLVLPFFGVARSMNYILLALAIPGFVFFNTWNQTVIPMINLLGRHVVFSVLTVLSSFCALLFSSALVLLGHVSAIFWFFGQVLGVGLLAIVGMLYFLKRIEHRFDFKAVVEYVRFKNIKAISLFSFPLALSVLFLWLQGQSYRLLIENYINLEFLGFFGVGMSIATSISSSFESIVMQWLYPALYRNMNDDKIFENALSGMISVLLPVYFFLALFVSFLALYLVEILVGSEYSRSSIFVVFGIWVEFFRMSANLLSMAAHSKMNTRSLFVPYAIGGVGVFVGVFFAAQFECYRVAIPLVLLIVGGLSCAVMFFRMNRLVRIDFRPQGLLFLGVCSAFFPSAMFFSESASNKIVSMVILLAYGILFLAGLLKFFFVKGNREALLMGQRN
ncbi:Membrane protein involved in the export of O-antigen and teichoic acid [Pseudomonas asplenii]|uniref:Membrane protein involved in the export of O-antigen and teichoic acid n=1 Tax=Pseudomonas asplenii TaxID=53407 RepID=A0A1H1RHA5_9PSED|nr:oligosaccharide flippase family protein [Pseudomonas asplenii]SDS35124.1 Membrane protein involved in the export of O-antigen and teichoic acid [Pseudomonas asplenii]